MSFFSFNDLDEDEFSFTSLFYCWLCCWLEWQFGDFTHGTSLSQESERLSENSISSLNFGTVSIGSFRENLVFQFLFSFAAFVSPLPEGAICAMNEFAASNLCRNPSPAASVSTKLIMCASNVSQIILAWQDHYDLFKDVMHDCIDASLHFLQHSLQNVVQSLLHHCLQFVRYHI